MEAQIERLGSAIIEGAIRKRSNFGHEQARYLVGIAGIAGSGKTSLAHRLVGWINKIEAGKGFLAMAVSLDGWHFARAKLDEFEDPAEAHRRRGSPETFDAKAYRIFLDKLSEPGRRIEAPTFSHTLKDPVEDGMVIESGVGIIVIEGLYTLFTETEDWARACEKLDFKVMVRVSESISKARLVRRHVSSGICVEELEARRRVETNDHPNGERMMKHMATLNWVVDSIEDPSMECEVS